MERKGRKRSSRCRLTTLYTRSPPRLRFPEEITRGSRSSQGDAGQACRSRRLASPPGDQTITGGYGMVLGESQVGRGSTFVELAGAGGDPRPWPSSQMRGPATLAWPKGSQLLPGSGSCHLRLCGQGVPRRCAPSEGPIGIRSDGRDGAWGLLLLSPATPMLRCRDLLVFFSRHAQSR